MRTKRMNEALACVIQKKNMRNVKEYVCFDVKACIHVVNSLFTGKKVKLGRLVRTF